jgi:hypothetical protein
METETTFVIYLGGADLLSAVLLVPKLQLGNEGLSHTAN